MVDFNNLDGRDEFLLQFEGRAPLSVKTQYDNAMKWANTYSPEDFPRLTQAYVLLFEMPSIVLLESTLLESTTQSRIVSS